MQAESTNREDHIQIPGSGTALTRVGPDAAHGCGAGKPQRRGMDAQEGPLGHRGNVFNSPVLQQWQQQHWGEAIAGKEKEKTLC